MGAVGLGLLIEESRSGSSNGATAWQPKALLAAESGTSGGTGDYSATADSGGNVLEIPPQLPPPVPPVTVEADPDNAFPVPPFDENGCPILSPSDLQALTDIPLKEMAAISEPTTELPPLPEGYDVMPLAQGNGLLTETEDMFRFRAVSTSDNVAVSFFGRVQRPSGYILPFNFTLNTSTPNTTFSTVQQCGKGLLLGCAASVPLGAITAGAVNAIGEIGRVQGSTFTPHTLLFTGQLDDLYPLTIDGGGLPPTYDRPTLKSTTSAGATLSFKTIVVTPTAGKRMRFVHCVFTNTSNAAAGERTPFCIFQQGGTSMFRSFTNLGQGASSTVQSAFSIGANNSQNCPASLSAGIPVGGSLPESLYFYEAVTVLLGVSSSFAGDSITNAGIFWEES